MSVKKIAIQTLSNMSDTVSWNDVMYTLYVKQKVEAGLDVAKEGNTVSHEEAKARLLG
jgi:predicted transcriptional regulator